ncbi:Polysaccharide pyruvyl transferase [Quadrisphaera granulorum]|uniref:Polysaccharide pyruvyl transferase n=2 Tax=Quadrisphaera granulorum TaxID=317664 RepID=A0A316ACU8_9ACTN|nr:polysaccharide pyruvyl transferase [Quadrisphaera granulorum]SZE96076.1 Polysaccharide pyruvyl transferase [Quadrisphaera granulorum]
MRAVEAALLAAGVDVDLAWSPVMATAPGAGGVELSRADPDAYTDLVWACGPLHGRPVAEVAARFSRLRRTAVGVSVVDDDDEGLRAWHLVLARDAPGIAAVRDLAAGPAAVLARDLLGDTARPPSSLSSTSMLPPSSSVPAGSGVVGVYLAPGQAEYGVRRRHDAVTEALGHWLGSLSRRGVARLALDTRLDPRGWRDPATAAEVLAIIRRCDAVVTMRLHGLVLALAAGVPAVAVDPVAGGGKVSAQARAWGWPAVISAEQLLGAAPAGERLLGEQLAWAMGERGRAAAQRAAVEAPDAGREQLEALVSAVLAPRS